ncbi:MAG: zf-HC2 domain-containing protein, partial [Clostridiales bacterium]|nr:zf-HC2 domain-containing protein [Clostridiales bacterium]
MMKCEDIRKNLDLFIDSEILSDEERKEINAHLDQCEDCKREYEEMKKIKEDLKALGDVELPKDFHDNLIKKLKGTNKKPQPFMQRHYKWFVGAAAVMLLGVMTTAGMLFLPFGLKAEEAPMAMYEKGMDSNYGDSRGAVPTESLDYEMATDEAYPEMEITMSEAVAEEAFEERKIIKNMYIELDTQDIEMAFNSIHVQVSAIGGYVEYSNIGNVGYYYNDMTKSQEEMRYA